MRKRSNYRPKPIGLPLSQRKLNALLMTPWVAVQRLRSGEADGEDGHTLLCFLNVALEILRRRSTDTTERRRAIAEGAVALRNALNINEDAPRLLPNDFDLMSVAMTLADAVMQCCKDHEVRIAINSVYEEVTK